MKTKNFIFTLLTLFVSITVSAETWTDANGTEWYFITNGSNATISNRGRDNVNSRIIPSISGTIPNDLAIPSTVYIGETPYSVKSIGSDAFWDCSYLTSVTIPDGVTTIGNNSFCHCYNLTSLIIPEGVTSIEDYAFQHCSGLTSITIPKSVTSIGKLAFDYCGSLTSINVISGNTKYDSRNNCNAIIETSSNTLLKGCKNTVIPASIISIGEYAFNNCYEMTSITIPEGVVSIGDCAFLECSRLTSITIPNGVTCIGRSAFWGCTSLTSITIPNSVSKIGEIAFYGISYLESIVVEEGNTVYDSRNNCNAIIETASNTLLKGCKNTIIPSSVKSIDTGAFNECRDLASITIPEGVTSIGNYAFRDCWDLSSINIPESVIFIGQGAFENTSWFRTQPDGVLYINSIAYAYKGSMPENTSIVIEDGTTHLSPGIFNGSRNLVSISLPESVTSIGDYTFSHCSGLSSITIPTSVTTIGEFAFDYCRNLTSIIIPKNVTQIGRYAFDDCTNLSYIKIPESVTSIGQSAFLRCSGLEYVICDAKSPIILSSNIFAESNYRNATLYVPKGSKAAYQSADVWKDFKEIMEYNYVDGSQDPPVSEFNAALAAITDGSYYLTTDVNGTKYYVTQNGHLTNDEESAYVFAISKVNASGAVSPLFDVAFLIDPGNGVHFSNPTPLLDGKAYLHLGFFYQDDHNNRNDWDRQVLFLNETGKFAIRSSNTPYDENSWLDAGRTFWTWEVGTDNSIIPCYSYEPAYIWTLEEAGAKEGFWTDANGTEWYFTINEGNAIISSRGWDDVNSCNIPSISGTIPTNLTIPSIVYIGETSYTVTSIGGGAFKDCSGLTSVNIPNSVNSIGGGAFYNCFVLSSVDIPNSVTSIGKSAFYGCSGLTSVMVRNETPVIISNFTFSNCTNATLYVPFGCKAAYESADYWKDFKEIVDVSSAIDFADANVKAICVANWDTNSDEELSYTEAAAVTDLGEVFKDNEDITSFNELRHFTGLTEIGVGAFSNAQNLSALIIPCNVKKICSRAFGDTKLSNLTIPEGVETLETNALFGIKCPIIIPSTVSSIGNSLLWGDKPEAIVVADGNPVYDSRDNCNAIIETASNTLIAGCSNTIIPNSVTSIGWYAFSQCTFESIDIPNSVTYIGGDAFYECSNLSSIIIPASVTKIEDREIFGICNRLTSIIVESGNTVYDSRDNCNAIIETSTNKLVSGCSNTIIPSTVTSIGSSAFYYINKDFITLPVGLKNIESGAFCGSGLTSIIIPEGVESIGSGAFFGCGSLTSVIVKNPTPVTLSSVEDFANSANATLYVPAGSKAAYEAADYWKDFKEIKEFLPEGSTFTAQTAEGVEMTFTVISESDMTCMVGTEEGEYSVHAIADDYCGAITIPSEVDGYTVTRVGDWAFSHINGLTSVNIPSSVTSIGVGAFYDCSGLASVIVPDNVTVFEPHTFVGTLLNSIPGKPKIIKDSTFGFCNNFVSITIPNSVTTLGAGVFAACTNLTSITIPKSVTSMIELGYGCVNLQSIVVEGENPNYDSRNNCNAIIETSTNTLILGCNNTIIPNNVTRIGPRAFWDCEKLTSVVIPASVTSMDSEVFLGCDNLTSYTVKNPIPATIGEDTFTSWDGIFSNYANSTLYVPAGSKAAYEAADYWKDFKEIVEFDTDISQLNNVIYINNLEAHVGQQITLSLRMKNSAAIRGFQFDLYLPEGVTAVKNAKGRIQGSLSNGRLPEDDAHTLTITEQTDGTIRFLCGSQYDETFTGTDGEIATLTVQIAEEMPDGDYPIIMKAMKLTETDISKFYETALIKSTLTVSSYIPGDINGDNKVDVSDYIGVANHIMGNTPTGFNVKAADVDGNGIVDVSDYIGIANFIMTGSIYGSSSVKELFYNELEAE